ncbi:hypothetical protein T4D_811 [Trichinella pseudospiralis]|uniref:Uncharacterized protein n=1 Tax=Trichinella pseudospiralis TaxID=6337 RepID=A0A0V1F7R0_TRIPS|nr:hypothetical protein T4D_811 [Trichinella pseudospiralis]
MYDNEIPNTLDNLVLEVNKSGISSCARGRLIVQNNEKKHYQNPTYSFDAMEVIDVSAMVECGLTAL